MDGARTDASGSTLGATIDDIRRQNLAQVLRLVHRDGPMSRAEITKATALNRSTVGGLVSELSHRGLVVENPAAAVRKVGRPSPSVAASDQATAIAVNPEVDAIDVALVGLSGRVLHRVRYRNERTPTVGEFVNVVSAIIEGMRPAFGDTAVLGVGVALPGLVREVDGSAILAPHLGWRDAPIGLLVEEATGMRVVVGNDANCGVVAESTFGAGRGDGVVIYLNGGASGIGGGIVINGRLVGGEGGNAGEFGHTAVSTRGCRCHCGATGCLETEVRRDRFVEAAGLGDVEPGAVLDAMAASWLDRNAAGAVEIDRQVSRLAVALRSIVNIFNPRTIILGGHLAHLLAVVGEDEIHRRIAPTLPGGGSEPEIVGARLNDELLLIGAAELVFAQTLADPTVMPREVASSLVR
ncbi:Sugar kinase of the NBD/HSP70 family, may contain an N-terminal HTH domain [Agromyces sp. CF514]|uniref:ROK family transcriptional regulator n=1 Tax=Agromyces sp. CF514 TaxID=1881031 RepID=UPI0008DFA4BA|nr:ROK family transcriptional regulator [Agromyces sp. CF514]SFR70446.1 Sugar kinase of the NBD/HSP70 family, may contain an N-terminal HTH domain [Agromyces sp. CF514]